MSDISAAIVTAVVCVAIVMRVARHTRLRSFRRRQRSEVQTPELVLVMHADLSALQGQIAHLQDAIQLLQMENESLRHKSGRVMSNGAPGPLCPEELLARAWLRLDPATEITAVALREAYAAAVKKHHPDAGGSAEAIMAVRDAYAWLGKKTSERTRGQGSSIS